ncbi:MAG: carboxyl-terminal processing protease [Gammaproteobacteria bacterium]|jgi:carboxyl-terminal processing protease
MHMYKIIALFITVCLLSLPVSSLTPTVAESELVPSQDQEQAIEIILHIIENYHYRKKALDDNLSSEILETYLKGLDPNRSFFTQQDISQFEQYRYQLDDALDSSNLDPAFIIFKRYRNRVQERVSLALAELESDFDFTEDEDYGFDRTDSPWSDITDLEEIWRKRVKNDYLSLKLANKEQDEIKETLSKRYQRLATSTLQYNASDIFQLFVNAYTGVIEPHTSYFSPRTSENFDISMSLSLEGIGAVLRGDTDYTEVQSVVPGGPADLSGELKDGDKIIGVGQEEEGEIIDVIGWRLDDVVDLIRGPKGSLVRLEILAKDEGIEGPSKKILITRDEIKLEESAAKSEIIENESGNNIGVITVPTFYSDFAAQAAGDPDYKSTTRDVRKLLAEMESENVNGIIIDLRDNGGGSLSEAIEFTGLFIESGPVVQTKDSSGNIDINRDRDPSITYGGPLAVLVNRNSASASEIYAGAIQDYRRGVIIGEPTFGKGTVQNIVDLNRFTRSKSDYGRLKTTIAQFFRINGGSNQHKGVIPDITFPTAALISDHGERSLDNAIPWDEIKAAKFVPAQAPVDRYNAAKVLHENRIKTDKLFQLLLDERKLAYTISETKVISLQESKRKLEREKLTKSRKNLQNEFRIAQGLEPLAEESDDEEFDKTEPVDVILNEAARILEDLSRPIQTTTAASIN